METRAPVPPLPPGESGGGAWVPPGARPELRLGRWEAAPAPSTAR